MLDASRTVLQVPVNLGTRSYVVEVGGNLLGEIGRKVETVDRLKGRKSCAVITDSNVAPLYAQGAVDGLKQTGNSVHLITVPAGESSKSLGCAESVCCEMARAGLDRKSFVIALGGGVIGDLAGFCASIYQRGIPYVQVPTTVLSQVDSSVGGKTGVNLPDAKNMVGCFHQPVHVLADVTTLASLPKREWNEGFAEIIKHACIRDAAMLEAIEAVADGTGDLAELIRRNIAIKAAVVEADEFETTGIRALLNFGHTLGHAIEAAAGYGRMLHGEAISLGLRAAGWLSTVLGGLSAADYKRIVALLQRFELPTALPAGMDIETILRITRMDKKFEGGRIRFVLLTALGQAEVSTAVTQDHMVQALHELRSDLPDA